MIAGIRVCNVGELAALLPVKFPGFHDDAPQSGAVAADKLGSGMDHHVCAVLDGTDQVRGAEGIINDQRQVVLVGNGRNGIDVRDVTVRVAQGLQIDTPGVFLNGVFHFLQIMGIHKSRGNAILR